MGLDKNKRNIFFFDLRNNFKIVEKFVFCFETKPII